MTAGDVIVISENAGGRKGNYFDGTDDYVLHDAHAVARVAAGDTVGTYTAWIYIDTIGAAQAILSAGDNNSATEYLEFFIGAAGQLKIKLQHGGATQFEVSQTTATMVAKTWYHVAVVQNGTRPTLYVDGKAVAMTDNTATDLTDWYGKLTLCDKFAIGVLETNATHSTDFKGAIGQVKYWNIGLTAEDMAIEYDDDKSHGTAQQAILDAGLYFNVTYENDGTTDSGLGADNGTLTGDAIYGGEINDWSYKINQHVTGHAAEVLNTVIDGSKYVSVIKRGD